MTREQAKPEHWHVDKGVPVALIVSLGITLTSMGGSGVWVASHALGRIERIEEKLAEQNSFRDDITTLKVQVQNLTRLTERVEALLERRTEVEKTDRVGGL